MQPEFIREAIKAPGLVKAKHKNGVIYTLENTGKMQVNGEWTECVMYYSLNPYGQFCRAITDFQDFKYLHNETIRGPR